MIFTPNINVITNESCNIYIEDTSAYPEKDGTKHQFRYQDTMSIYVLRHNKIKEYTFGDAVFSKHIDKNLVQLPVKVDGWFSVVVYVLPTKEWFEANRQSSVIDLYDFLYYTDGCTIYKYCPKTKKEPQAVSLYELMCVADTNKRTESYSVYTTEQDYVSICFLRKCYINLCKQILENRGFTSCWNKNNVDSELVYKRDLAWMAINIITYLTKQHSKCNPTLAEVERIIETIQGCNGLCTNSNSVSKNDGCGCPK